MSFQSSLEKKRKGIVSFAERSLEDFETLQLGPWSGSEMGREVDRPDSGERGRRRRGPRGYGVREARGAPAGVLEWGAE
jgi:hypothetical protein